MINLQQSNAQQYLSEQPAAPPGPWTVIPLGGGVSNTVLRVDCPSGAFVLKQSLGRLRVEEEWLADQGRIRRECAALRALRAYLPPASLPAVIFEDRAHFIFALEAASPQARDWKSVLLRGEGTVEQAERAGEILRALVLASERDHGLRAEFEDQTCFDQLRLDPYYRFTAGRHPDLKPYFDLAIEKCRRPMAMVHGDFSPKNFLVDANRMILIDFEVVHLGDPAFDAAFLLNHLLLKKHHGIRACPRYAEAFWGALGGVVDESDTILHLGCLQLARIDGKSPAEYLSAGERETVRAVARELIRNPPKTIREAFNR